MIFGLLLVSQFGLFGAQDATPGFSSYQGRIYVSDVGLDFRPCNEASIYSVDGSYATLELIGQFFQSGNSNKSIYIRFLGKTESTRPHDGGVIRIERLVHHTESIPTHCN